MTNHRRQQNQSLFLAATRESQDSQYYLKRKLDRLCMTVTDAEDSTTPATNSDNDIDDMTSKRGSYKILRHQQQHNSYSPTDSNQAEQNQQQHIHQHQKGPYGRKKWSSASSSRYRNNSYLQRNSYQKKFKQDQHQHDQQQQQQQKWQKAVQIEKQLNLAIESITAGISTTTAPRGNESDNITNDDTDKTMDDDDIRQFPHIRDCNAAIATFGDHGDFLRAVRLYFKMRKTLALMERRYLMRMMTGQKNQDTTTIVIDDDLMSVLPIPTLVTYSTLMSRAISDGKPKVALRLWKIMKKEPRYMKTTNDDDDENDNVTSNGNNSNSVNVRQSIHRNGIVPDIKAANILMNAYAKLNDLDSCERLMMQMMTTTTTTTKTTNSDSSTPSIESLTETGRDTSRLRDEIDRVRDVPRSLRPNLVTYNTLLDACHKAGELDRALYWKDQLDREAETAPLLQVKQRRSHGRHVSRQNRSSTLLYPPRADTLTYTTLIATVAPRARLNQRQQRSGGSHDPSLAFRLMEEMKDRGIRPNGLTYSALIDACGRCRRSDLALQGLRYMLDDQRREAKEEQKWNNNSGNGGNQHRYRKSYLEDSRVGAWTSAINACGKSGRIDTALKLFFVSMPRFGVRPNTVTCGCLLDCLLREGENRTADTLEVLRYMKDHGIPPSQVMYTSLMTYASKLATTEQRPISHDSETIPTASMSENAPGDETGDAKAVDIYGALMSSLLKRKPSRPMTETGNQNEELFQVSLLFQDMKASGVIPDLACYNVLLRTCAQSGDVEKALEVLEEMTDDTRDDDIEPNDRTWRELLRCASTAKRPDILMKVWKIAIERIGPRNEPETKTGQGMDSSRGTRTLTKISMKTLRAFLTALLRCAWNIRKSDRVSSLALYRVVIQCYHASLSGSTYMGMDLVEDGAFEHPHIMASFLQAVVTLENLTLEGDSNPTNEEFTQLRVLGKSIVSSETLSTPSSVELTESNPHYLKAIRTAKSWLRH